ncbi:MAG: hydroxyproline-2-epimerase, partial [Akkermansiaceae bacterium]|nr:hydroxyproline-2-epimerase [Akkermansiaceae bacterium]
NWFFLTEGCGPKVCRENIEKLTAFGKAVREELQREGITGADGAEIDHVEVFGKPESRGLADSRNFVLCPGNAYDRSPCGTGTSAKMACLHADGLLREGDAWRQASILDTVFEGRVEALDGNRVVPHLTGSAFVTAEATLVLDPADPFRDGVRA